MSRRKRSFKELSKSQNDIDNLRIVRKKRRITFSKPLIVKYVNDEESKTQEVSPINPHLHCTDFYQSQSQSTTQSGEFSRYHSQSESQSLTSSFSETSETKISFAQNIPAVLLQHILSFNTPYELSNCCEINTFYNKQCKIMWNRLTSITVSPALFPSLIDDDYDSQFEYNPNRHPHRTHNTLNWIIGKLKLCDNLQKLVIKRTMMNGTMLQNVITNCPNLKILHFDENPWIFLLRGMERGPNSMDIDIEMYRGNLFDSLTIKPSLKLTSFRIESMFINLSDITFNRLLSSSILTLKELILKKRDPFTCSYCNRLSLCKWHKCEDCELRSYCSRECQSNDWWYHQYVCSYHDPRKELSSIQGIPLLGGGILDTVCLLKNLLTLDLTWSFIVNNYALNMISISCKNLQNIILNGCDVDDNGIISLINNLDIIKTLHCRAARYVTDRSINELSKSKHCKTLIDIDITRCCLISKGGVINLIDSCNKLVSLSIACGIKRGGWIWCMDDNIANKIINGPLYNTLNKLEYIYNEPQLNKMNETKLFQINNGNIFIQKITTDIQTALQQNINGQLSVVFVNQHSQYSNPVKLETIKNGEITYTHRFRR